MPIMASCPHVDSADLKQPAPSQAVYREDCTQCFDSIDDETGLNVCLSCFNGGCTGDRNHGSLHYNRTGHPLALNIKRSRKKTQRDEPPQKMSKLAIAPVTEDDIYETKTRVVCYSCHQDDIDSSVGRLPTVIQCVMKALTFSKMEEVKAWEQEFVPCEHTLCLEQGQPRQIPSQDLGQCSMCDLKENLWLCLECGNLGCGRSQFGGVGGNSHALMHSDMTSHGVAVKLGSLTADGMADIYCYKCNEERTDPELATHLANWGINIADREKTEKSLMEMQIDHNMKWDFTMTSGDGRELAPIFGPGFTGLSNLGNSCYLSSITQCLFNIPEFRQRYYHPGSEPPLCESPARDLETQLRKLADGIHSGRYSRPDTSVAPSPDSGEVLHQTGVMPSMFKHLVGYGHPEFATMRQQDALEFLTHIFKSISLSKHDGLSNPIQSFGFATEQRIQCTSCRKVRYKVDEQDSVLMPVPARRPATLSEPLDQAAAVSLFEPVSLSECLDALTGDEVVDMDCPSCGNKKNFTKRALFKTLPQQLVINARRFGVVNWVPTKLEIPVEVGDDPIEFSPYLSTGHDESEELLPDEDSADTFTPNQVALDQLMSMGFPSVRCEKALYVTGNSDPEAAMNWLIEHIEDPDIDEPLKLGGSSAAEQDPAKVAQLGEMGIDPAVANKGLAATNGDITRAIDWVFSHPEAMEEEAGGDQPGTSAESSREPPGFSTTPAKYQLQSMVCHKGSSLHAGHYVAFVRKVIPGQTEPSWVLFNDEKVVKASDVQEMKKFAYMYFFTRV